MKGVLEEVSKLPKELPTFEQKDYVAQFDSLTNAIKSVEKVVKAQKLIAEAPKVTVEAPRITVEQNEVDISALENELQTSRKEFTKAIKSIVIPETDTKGIEKQLKSIDKLLNEFLDAPRGGGGGGSSSPTVFTGYGVLAVPVANPDGSNIGGSGGLTDTELRASPVEVDIGINQPTTPSDTQPVSLISIPLANDAAKESKQNISNSSLSSIDAKTKDTPSTVRNGQKTVAVTNTAVAIISSSTPVVGVIIQALASNVNNIKVGDSSVVSSSGFELQPGQAVGLAIDNLNKVYINGTVADGVCFLGS